MPTRVVVVLQDLPPNTLPLLASIDVIVRGHGVEQLCHLSIAPQANVDEDRMLPTSQQRHLEAHIQWIQRQNLMWIHGALVSEMNGYNLFPGGADR